MAFGTETYIGFDGVLKKLRSTYNSMISKMLQLKPQDQETAGEYVHRRNAWIQRLTIGSNQCLQQKINAKSWRYIGHALRSEDNNIINVMLWRSWDWWIRQPRGIYNHRLPGWHMQSQVDNVMKFLNSEGFDIRTTQDREIWRNLEDGWINFAMQYNL